MDATSEYLLKQVMELQKRLDAAEKESIRVAKELEELQYSIKYGEINDRFKNLSDIIRANHSAALSR